MSNFTEQDIDFSHIDETFGDWYVDPAEFDYSLAQGQGE